MEMLFITARAGVALFDYKVPDASVLAIKIQYA